ncbi:MAG TPA: ABC transporter permease [Clostridiaceae bacterium]|nr:ABC transporter permease [Clostridiaceae bacterium]
MRSKQENNKKLFLLNKLKSLDVQNYVLIVLMILLIVSISFVNPKFLRLRSFEAMINNYTLEGIMALGMTLVIISGGIDLSIAGIMPFSAIIYAYLIKAEINIYISMLIVLIIALFLGFINNFLRSLLKVHPFVVTLAMQLTLKGLNLVITDSQVITDFPENFTKLSNVKILGLSIPILVLIVLVIFYGVMLSQNRYFRYVYFVGSNPRAAELSGINTRRYFRFIYMQSGLLAGIAGIIACFIFNSAHASYGTGIETRVITIVAAGGASMIRGGIGNIRGTVLGLIFISMVYSSFIMSGISTYYQDVVTGLLLILAVVFSEKFREINIKTNIFKKREEENV